MLIIMMIIILIMIITHSNDNDDDDNNSNNDSSRSGPAARTGPASSRPGRTAPVVLRTILDVPKPRYGRAPNLCEDIC